MKLAKLVSCLPQLDIKLGNVSQAKLDVAECYDMTLDSREVLEGWLFIAIPGFDSDGRNYLSAAIEAGAIAVFYELDDLSPELQREIDQMSSESICIGVRGLRDHVSLIAHHFFNQPSENLQIYAITGTNGKTSCAYLLSQSFNTLGHKTAFMGTIGIGMPDALETSTHTTLDAISLQRKLKLLLEQGFTHVCMEVSSHALDQGRVTAIEFYAVLYTNLSQDHLDYHRTMAEYAKAKQKLFDSFSPTLAVINTDDEFGQALLELTNADFVVSYGIESGDVRAEDIQAIPNGLSFLVVTDTVELQISSELMGLLNVPNLLLISATLLALGVSIEQIQASLLNVKSAPGRMELFHRDHHNLPVVVVDYAHTPDALQRALSSCQVHCSGDLWAVFGCGGDRDVTKRALMGKAAEQYADKVVLTNDNPRSELPEKIFQDILAGMSGSPIVIENRAAAVAYAIDHADKKDMVLVAGKGHEGYQQIGDQMNPYSDREWVVQCLEAAA